MNFIGISGLAEAENFKRSTWPGRSDRDYRISQGYDSAAALVTDGVVVAAAGEERFNREKHSAKFPAEAIRYCLREAGLRSEEIDGIAHGFAYEPFRGFFSLDPISKQQFDSVFSRDVLVGKLHTHFPEFPAEKVRSIEHHLAHAASAFYTSGFDDALVVVADAMGEVHGMSVYRGQGQTLEPLAHLPASDSIGILYSLVTLHLGFDFNSDEYKVMGLAPYGDPTRFRRVFEEMVQLGANGCLRIPVLRANRTREEREHFDITRCILEEKLGPPRHPDSDIAQVHQDIAAALQETLNRTMLNICTHFAESTGLRHLAMAGGVALNCTANGHLVRSGSFEDVYIQPASGDDGTALGAALQCAAEAGEIKNARFRIPFFGPKHCDQTVKQAFDRFADQIEVTTFGSLPETCATAARAIANGKVIAWHRGRMEFGPRALGNRSILADPGHPEMRDRVNRMVKMRESFRPFAPAATKEKAHRWFDIGEGTELPYMITIVNVRPEHRETLPAITHVDGTARLQTVAAGDNPEFHTLLCHVGEITGKEMVLNTSFNVKGQPIVNTPAEAIETFLGTGIDCVFIENNLVCRKAAALEGR